MKHREMEEKIRQAYAHAAPDVLKDVLADCQEPKGTVILMTEKTKTSPWVKRIAAAAAALVLLAGGLAGYLVYHNNRAVASTVSLDVNPSVEIQVNSKEKVLAVTARNEDGRTVIGDMDFTGSSLDVAVNALIGSMLRNGYLSELANSILVSVDSGDPDEGAALQQKLSAEIQTLLETNAFSGAVLSQTVSDDKELRRLADTYGITTGKAQLIQQIIAQNPLYTFEELVPLSINELNLLRSGADSAGNTGGAISSVGQASDKAYIGEAKAQELALNHAGVAASQISKLKIEMDVENGQMVYEVDFKANGYEYEYEIGAADGKIVKSEKEWDDDALPPSGTTGSTAGGQPAGTTVGAAAGTTSGKPIAGGTSAPSGSSYIGEAKAKAIALSKAGVQESAIRGYEIELDRDDGIVLYEVEFHAGGYEYKVEIHAATGEVLDFDKEWDD